jgi:hypothetical protein
MLFERASIKVLSLWCPFLNVPPKEKKRRGHLYQSLPIKKVDIDGPSEYYDHLAAICDYLEITLNPDICVQRWGKCVIPGDITLRSRMSEEAGWASRSSRYFEAQEEGSIFGEALAFYYLPEQDHRFVVYHQLVETVDVLGRWCGVWSEDCMVLNISSITKLVGIWKYGLKVHILRKHAGLEMLDAEEYGTEEQQEE